MDSASSGRPQTAGPSVNVVAGPSSKRTWTTISRPSPLSDVCGPLRSVNRPTVGADYVGLVQRRGEILKEALKSLVQHQEDGQVLIQLRNFRPEVVSVDAHP